MMLAFVNLVFAAASAFLLYRALRLDQLFIAAVNLILIISNFAMFLIYIQY